MKRVLYDDIILFIANHPAKLFRDVVKDVAQRYKDEASEDTLLSICLIQHQKNVKKTFMDKSRDWRVEKYYKFYKERASSSLDDKSTHLLELSAHHEIPPALMARLILTRFLQEREELKAMEAKPGETVERLNIKSEISSMMKNPFSIPDARLSYEVRCCVLHDVGYGCVTDSIRHMVGNEYEDKLKIMVQNINVPFQDETELRKLGYDKTPDIKLHIPIAVDDKVVCWIESKASFGTPSSHQQYLEDQYYSYLNRFGPGLVIYWFGYVDDLAEEGDNILLSDSFPSNDRITLFKPEVQAGNFGEISSEIIS